MNVTEEFHFISELVASISIIDNNEEVKNLFSMEDMLQYTPDKVLLYSFLQKFQSECGISGTSSYSSKFAKKFEKKFFVFHFCT